LECRWFNQPLEWDVSHVLLLKYMLLGADNFNQDLTSWDVVMLKI